MKTFLAAAALLFSFAVQAEIVIYTQTVTDKATGGGAVTTKTYGGKLIFDTDTLEVRSILTRAADKTFVEIGSDATVKILDRSATGKTLWAYCPVFDTGGASFKGACAVMTLGTTNSFYVPRLLTVTGSSHDEAANTLHEYTGTLTLDRAASVQANRAGTDFAAQISLIETSLFDRGYLGDTGFDLTIFKTYPVQAP